MDRAYAVLEIKSFDTERRTFYGVATTPTPDRAGDVIDPLGARFTNPIPLLLHHDRKSPVGTVTLYPPTAAGITFEATIPEVREAGAVQARTDEAWHSIKAGLLRGISIGMRPFANAITAIKGAGFRIGACEICELSLVTVPANLDATITTIKSLAAIGPNPPGATGSLPVVRADKAAPVMHQTTTEQITAFQHTRTTKSARMVALMEKAGAEHVTLDETETAEYDALASEIKSIDAHLSRLDNLESLMVKAAKPVLAPASAAAALPVIQVRSQLPKGTAFTRYAMAMCAARGDKYQAIQIAEKNWNDSTPEVALALKAAVAPGNTTDATWAGPLVPAVQNLANEFIELLRPATIIGRIPGLRRVPFNVQIPMQTAGGSYGWVGQGLGKPVTKLGFGTTALGFAKAAGIIVITEELARFSSPSAEAIIQADMIAGIAEFLDKQFIDETVAPVANVHPGSITNGITPLTAAATGASPFYQFIADVQTLVGAMMAAGIPTTGASLLASASNAFAISLARTQAQQFPGSYPGLTDEGGAFIGIPIIVSEAVGSRLILVSGPNVLLADDGGVTLDVSREASVQMDSAPAPADATTVLVSLWQNNLIGLRAERYINWKRVKDAGVQWMTGVSYKLSAASPFEAPAGRAEAKPGRG